MTADGPARPRGVPIDALLAHREWVRTLARSLVADPNVADDVEQETWRMALERPPQHAGSLRQWLSAVVRNAARGAGRSRATRMKHEARAPVRPGVPAPGDVVAEAEIQHRLVGEVLALEEPYRSAILQRFFEGHDASEIAVRTGAPVETVRTRIKRGLGMLRARMDVTLGDDDRAWCLLVLGWRPEGIPAPSPMRLGGAGSGTAGSGSSTGTTVTLTGAAGGMAMGLAGKLGVAAAVVVLALFAWRPWEAPEAPGLGGGAGAPPPAETSHAPPSNGKRARAADEDAPAAAPSNDLAAATSPDDARFAACDRDLDLHGVVVRKDGTPVAGAKLQSVSYPWRRANALNWDGAFEAALGPATTSAADGTFALRLRRGESVSLRVSKDGLAPLELVDRSAGERVRVVMEPGVRLVVRAVQHVPVPNDFREDPVPDVRLRVWRMLPKDGGTTVDVRGVTAADGRATFDDLPGGLDVMVMPESRLGNVGMKRLKLAESGESTLDLVLAPARTIRGRVTDAATGAPVAGARVGMAWPLVQAVTTQGDGTYALEGWTGDGFSDIHVLAAGYVRANAQVWDKSTLDFALQPGVAARGRVVGADGAPVAGALVSCMAMWRGDRVQHMSSADARTGADGVFHLTGLDGVRAHALTVVAPGAGRVQRSVTFPPSPAGETDMGDVTLAAARAIEGRVLDPTGDPAPRIQVSLTSSSLPSDVAENVGLGSRETRFTDDLGRFRFPDLAPGTYVVTAGVSPQSDRTARVVLPADRDVLDIVLPPQGGQGAAAPPGTIRVTVTDESGAPLAGVNVVGQGSLRKTLFALTDEKGRAVLDVPTDGSLRGFAVGYQAPRDFLRVPEIAVVAGRTEYAVAMVRGVFVSCVVLDPDGRPVPRASVSVEPSDRAVTWWSTDEEGRVRFVLPREGSYSFQFDGFAHLAGPTKPGEPYGEDTGLEGEVSNVTAGAGEVVMRCRRVASGCEATVRVLEADGRPAAGVSVTLSAAGAQVATKVTGADGRAPFEGLRGHRTHLWLAPRPGDIAPKIDPFVPDGQEVVIRYPVAVQISGMATWSTGEPAAGASITVLRAGIFCSTTNADAGGRFTAKLPAGDDGPFTIDAAAMRGGQDVARVSRPLSPTDHDIQLVLPR